MLKTTYLPTTEAEQRLLLRVGEAANMLSISKSRAYELIKKGVVPAISLDGTLRVPAAALQDMVRGALPQEAK